MLCLHVDTKQPGSVFKMLDTRQSENHSMSILSIGKHSVNLHLHIL